MKNFRKTFGTLSLILGLLLLTGGFCAAEAVTIPAKSAVNPIYQAMYIVDNAPIPAQTGVYSQIKTYQYSNGWSSSPNTLSLSGISITAQVFGLAVSDDGNSLFVSINDLTQSKVRIYTLANGVPTGTYQNININTEGSASLAGMAVKGDMLFVADMNLGKVHYFKNTNGTWAHTGDIYNTSYITRPLFDVAVSQSDASGNYLIFITNKETDTLKELLVYKNTGGTISANPVASFDLQVPTSLKVAGDKLCVALNGTDGDVKIYTISTSSPYLTEKATIKNPSGVTANYGWNGFDVTPDNTYLYYIQAQNASETSTKLYKVYLPTASGQVTALNVNSYTTTSKYDGLVISPDRLKLATTYSGNGSYLSFNLNSDLGNPGAIPPVVTSITPNSANWGGTNVSVSIKGEHFLSTTTAFLVNGTEYQILVNEVLSSTMIDATIDTTQFDNATKTYALRLKNGTSQNELLSAFTINKTNQAPNAPTNLTQNPAFGNRTNANTITLGVKMSDPNNPDTLTPEFKIGAGSWVAGSAVSYSGTAVSGTKAVDISALADGNYNWSARVKDAAAAYSPESAPTSNPDFIIDRTPPKVSSTTPAEGATGVASGATIKIVFNEAMQTSVFNGAAATVKVGGTTIAHTESYDNATNTLTITPNAPGLMPGAAIKVTLYMNSANQNITDVAGNALDGDKDGVSEGYPADEFKLNFTIGGSNSAPNDFNKISPPNISDVYTQTPTLSWEGNGDPDAGDYVDHYYITVFDNITHTYSYYTVAGTQTFYTFTAPLTIGTNYSWYVDAFDKWGTVTHSLPSWSFVVKEVQAPTIDTVIPSAGEQGQTLNVEITGTGFYDQTAVDFSGTGITKNSTVFNSATKMTVNISIANNATLSARDVTVTNPGQTPVTKTGAFTIVAPAPAPTIGTIVPASGEQGQTLDVVINGSGFNLLTDVAFSGIIKDIQVNSVTFNNDAKVTANITISNLADTTYRNVTVINPGGKTATLANGFKVNEATPTPTIKSIAPNNGLRGENVSVTIVGDNFAAGATVRLTKIFQTNIDAIKVIVVSAKEITCELPLPALAAVGTWNVEVLQGSKSAVLTDGFTINSSGGTADVPLNLKAAKSGNDGLLTWEVPQAGEPTGGYRVYRGTSPTTITTQIGGDIPVGAHQLTDTGALLTSDSYYYVVKSFSGATESGPSNMAYILKTNITHNVGIGNKIIISLPYLNNYSTLADILEDINGIADITTGSGLITAPTKVGYIARLNPATQVYETVSWDGGLGQWISSVDDFGTANMESAPYVRGEGFEIEAMIDFTLQIAGGSDGNFTFALTHNIGIGNKNIISIPYENKYSTISDILEDINGIADITTGSGLITAPTKVGYIARLNPATQVYETVSWDGGLGQWISSVDDFGTTNMESAPCIKGEGFEIEIMTDLSWKPTL
ncbi:MAG: Ig-like domain-containing protein [Candidatus Margulisiibacteriota bacterium]|jgi:hypothetical protein